MDPYFPTFLHNVLAKLTSKNQLTLPKSVTDALGPVQYFEVQEKAGQIVLTPVRIQRGDALRAKLAELAIDQKTLEAALGWAKPSSARKAPVRKTARAVAKPSSTAKTVKAAKKPPAGKAAKKVAKPASAKSVASAAPAKQPTRTAAKTSSRKTPPAKKMAGRTAAKPSSSRSGKR